MWLLGSHPPSWFTTPTTGPHSILWKTPSLLWNGASSFNPSILRIVLSGDIHPQPGPTSTAFYGSPSRMPTLEIQFPKNANSNIKIAHLNVRSFKSREHFTLVKDSILSNGFDIFTLSETWLDCSVSDSCVHIPGYSPFRQDRGPHKAGGGLCVYTRDTLKVLYMEDLSLVVSDGSQQLWLKVQARSCKSFLLNTVYRPPSTPVTFLDNFTRVFIDSLLCGLDIFIFGDLNCNLLNDNYEAKALLEFCSTFNLTQLINLPTRITESSQSLIDVIMAPNNELVGSMLDTSDQVDVYSALFLDVLNEHAPIKRIKIKARPNPFVTPEIVQLMKTRDVWHKNAMKTNHKLNWNA